MQERTVADVRCEVLRHLNSRSRANARLPTTFPVRWPLWRSHIATASWEMHTPSIQFPRANRREFQTTYRNKSDLGQMLEKGSDSRAKVWSTLAGEESATRRTSRLHSRCTFAEKDLSPRRLCPPGESLVSPRGMGLRALPGTSRCP